jgi:hypothetical protein
MKSGMQGTYLPHPSSNSGLLLLGEDDARMLHSLTGQSEEVGVVGAQDAPHGCGSLKVVAIIIPKHFKTVGRYNIQTAAASCSLTASSTLSSK